MRLSREEVVTIQVLSAKGLPKRQIARLKASGRQEAQGETHE